MALHDDLIARLAMLRRDLEPYRGKTVGSLRIDMGEVQAILAACEAADALATLQADNAAKDARIAVLEEALRIADSWLERWAQHVGNCRGDITCTCGLTRVRYDVISALSPEAL